MSDDGQIARAEMLLELRRPAEARALLEPLLAADPRNATAQVMIAECLLGEDRARGAFDTARAAAASAPDDVTVLVRCAAVARRAGYPDGAATWARHALSLAPTSVVARNVLTLVQIDRGNAISALHHAEIALAQRPDDQELRVAHAMALNVARKPVKAAREYAAVLRMDPANVYAMNNLAAIRLQHGDVGGAGALWARALATDPRFVIAASNLELAGMVFRQLVAARVALIISLPVLAGAWRAPVLYLVSALVAAWTAWTSARMPTAVRRRLLVNLRSREKLRYVLIALGSVLAVVGTLVNETAAIAAFAAAFYMSIYGVLVTLQLLSRRLRLDVGLWLAGRRRADVGLAD
jgi:Flp pilus assembly protein TadD